MGENGILLIFIGFAILAGVLGYYAHKAEQKRKEELFLFATRHGFQYFPERVRISADFFGLFGGGDSGGNPVSEMEGFRPFGTGDSRQYYNWITGVEGGKRWDFFDYQYSTGSGKNRTTHHYGIATVVLPMAFMPFQMRPETAFDRIGHAFGLKDIQFELEEFNRRYSVRCEDAQFAYNIVDPQMMDYLMSIPGYDWQFAGMRCVIAFSSGASGTQLERVMQDVNGFYDRIPEFVKRDFGARS